MMTAEGNNLIRSTWDTVLWSFILSVILLFSACDSEMTVMGQDDDEPDGIEITSPAAESRHSTGESIYFDVEFEGVSSGMVNIVWTSNLDGEIGSGRRVEFSELSTGVHEISVIARFPDETELSTLVLIYVDPRSRNARVRIIPPEVASLWFYDTEWRLFYSIVTDSTGTVLSNTSVEWTSDIDGVVGTSGMLSSQALSLGLHTLVLQATFPDGSSDADTLAGVSIVEDPWKHTDLLNDRELESAPDPDAPAVRDPWQEWMQSNVIPIRSLTSTDYSDLAFLKTVLQGKRIVQMGEVAHGIAEQNSLRVRLIKYLHEELGYNVVAFESGFFPCYTANQMFANTDPRKSLFNSLNNIWRTPEVLDLFEYMRETHLGGNPLKLAGFDIYPTGDLSLDRPAYLRDLALPLDSDLAVSLFDHDQILIQYWTDRQAVIDYVAANYSQVDDDYARLERLVADNYSSLLAFYGQEEMNAITEIVRSVRSFILFRAQTIDVLPRPPDNERDRQMASTARYLIETIYPGEKMIVWAHNMHILEDAWAIQGPRYGKLLGGYLDEWYGGELYTMVSLSYRGRIDYGVVQDIEITQPDGIEAILFHGGLKHFFLNLETPERSPGNSWMDYPRHQLYLHSSGTYDVRYIPRDQFDGILYIDTVSKPERLY